jgi:hypothetical protein
MSAKAIDIFEIPEIPDTDVSRGKVLDLEDAMRKVGAQGHAVTIETKHHFADGLYAREIFIPKGTLLTGKIHLFEHLNVISKGDISVMTEDGIKRITAPAMIVSKPGIKRVGFAHEDTVWTTIHACAEKDAGKAEAMLVVDTYEQFALAAEKDKPCLLLP